ncbi:hypothetical protein [Flavobacterium coralii]|uniref:hypothetical protein n=1 Tax=Flavobacterium coralii TaxID=2838017 RepID=UPI001CA61898|nr:hypothetical protein [Flavobacterium coralii]
MLSGKKFIGIECFTGHNTNRYAFVQVEKKKNNLEITASDVRDEDGLKKYKAKHLTALIINTNQVLQKLVDSTDLNDKKVLQKAFPNIKSDDFYYEIWRKKTVSLIAICRKTYVDELVKKISQDFRISAIGLGVCPVAGLTSFTDNNFVSTNTHTVGITDESIFYVTAANNTSSTINGLTISSSNLNAFSAVLGLLTNKAEQISGNTGDFNKELYNNAYQHIFFEKAITFSIGIIITLLLINFLIFNYYFKKVTELESTISISKSELISIHTIAKKVEEKEARLNSFTRNAASKSSLLLNNIGRSVPSTVQLSEITYKPLFKNIRESEKISFQDSILLISGKVLNNSDFTDWVNDVQQIEGIKKITISHFGKQDTDTEFSVKADIE